MGFTCKAKLKAGIKYDKSVSVYVTYAPALGIYSQGENIVQAKKALEDAIKSFISVYHEKGLLTQLITSADLSEREYIRIQQTILKQKNYRKFFDVPASIPLSLGAVS